MADGAGAVVVAFLRAVNLGATRRFPMTEVVALLARHGYADVRTHLATGNVLLPDPGSRTPDALEAHLEEVFGADRGFAVLTLVRTADELRALAAELDVVAAEHAAAGGHPVAKHYVSLLRSEPEPGRVAALAERSAAAEGESVVVRGRHAHLLAAQTGAYHRSTLDNAVVEKVLGVAATNRTAGVVRTLATRWAGFTETSPAGT